MVGVLSESEIEDVLREQQFARLGCSFDGQTYIVPISYAMDGESLVGWTSPGCKVEMMRKNPVVCVQLDDVKDLTDWRSVVAHGRFEELTGSESARAMRLLIDKYGPIFADMDSLSRRGRDVTPPRLDSGPSVAIVYRIRFTEKSGRYEKPDQF